MKGLSLRYKVLLLLSLLPLLALGAYLILAMTIFRNDKLAYVFDSSREVSKSMAAQVQSELTSARELIQAMTQGFNYRTGKVSLLTERVFNQAPSFDGMSFLLPSANGDGSYTAAKRLEKTPDIMANFEGAPEFKNWMNEIRETSFGVYSPFGDSRLLVGTLFGDPKQDVHFIVLSLVRAERLASAFAESLAYDLYLVDRGGRILFGPRPRKHESIIDFLPETYFQEVGKQRQPSSVQEVRDYQGNEFLASFSQVGYSGLIVSSLVYKSHALQAVQVLLSKSVLFFIVLISATGIISIFASNTLTSTLSLLTDAAKRIAAGDFSIRVNTKSKDEVGELATGFNFMAGEIERLLDETHEKARMENELQTAHMVQETLFPAPSAQLFDLKIAGHYQPASECGGDWWHYSKVNGKVYLWIGDATGHGAPAALITSAAKSAASIIENLKVSPGKALSLLNDSIYSVSKGQLMMTFFVASYDPETGELIYSNASHEPPFLIQKKEDGEPIKKRDLIPLNEVNGPRLGQALGSEYPESKVQLTKGDSLFFYTDGLTDVENPDGQVWGERNFLKTLIEVGNQAVDPDEFVQHLVDSTYQYVDGAPLKDDVTFLMCRRESA